MISCRRRRRVGTRPPPQTTCHKTMLCPQPPSASNEISLTARAETVPCYLFMSSYESYVGADKHRVVTDEAEYTSDTVFSCCSTRGRHSVAY